MCRLVFQEEQQHSQSQQGRESQADGRKIQGEMLDPFPPEETPLQYQGTRGNHSRDHERRQQWQGKRKESPVPPLGRWSSAGAECRRRRQNPRRKRWAQEAARPFVHLDLDSKKQHCTEPELAQARAAWSEEIEREGEGERRDRWTRSLRSLLQPCVYESERGRGCRKAVKRLCDLQKGSRMAVWQEAEHFRISSSWPEPEGIELKNTTLSSLLRLLLLPAG